MQARQNGQTNTALIAFVAALVLVFAYAIFQIVNPHSTGVETNELVTAQQVSTVTGRGCIVRAETVLQASATGLIYETVEDGKKVPANVVLCYVYPDVTTDNAAAVREQLRRFDQTLAELYEASGSASLSALPALRDDVSAAYAACVDAAQAGDLSALQALQDEWLTLLNRMKKLTDGTSYDETIALLEQTRAQLLAACGEPVTGTSLSARSGYYWSAANCDGYEAALTPDRLDSLTAAELQDVLDNERAAVGADCAGKMVYGATWYLVVPVSAADAERLAVNETYTVTLQDAGVSLPMTLCRVNRADDTALLVFSCSRQPEGFDYERLQNVSVTVGTTTGYRIPADAVTNYDDEWGVFILRGGTVYFRRVAVLATGTDYVLVSVSDTASGQQSDYAYLAATDMLITRGKKLYDGKVLS